MTAPKTFGDYEVEAVISFKQTPVVSVTFDPNGAMRDGKYGPELSVLRDGKPVWLPVKAAGLASQLKRITERCKVTITRSGSGMETSYEVKVAGKK